MRGELWQECEKSGCETEPVCVSCFYCARHCRCGDGPTQDQKDQAAQEKALIQEAGREFLEGMKRRAADPNCDVKSFSLEVQMSNGSWMLVDPSGNERYLERAVAREARYAEKSGREPLGTQIEVIRALLEGKSLEYGDDSYDRARREVPTFGNDGP